MAWFLLLRSMNYCTRTISTVLIVILGVLATHPVASQVDTTAESPLSVEELYLRAQVSVDTIRAQIDTGDRELRLLAIRSLRDQLEQGLLDPTDETLYRAVEPVVNEGVFTINQSVKHSLSVYDPMVRREAIHVMGMLGTDQAQAKLVKVAYNEPDPVVRAQALWAISGIATDADGQVSKTIGRIILRERAVATPVHQESMLAAVTALGAIAGDPANTFHPSALEALMMAATDATFWQVVREQAWRVIATL